MNWAYGQKTGDRTMTTNTLRDRASSNLRRFAADESGATAIEYALIAAGIAGAIITIVQGLGTKIVTNLYDKIDSVL
jgi:pilus assembly protein Flp/PilA